MKAPSGRFVAPSDATQLTSSVEAARSRRGLWVAVLGADGAGKSTLIEGARDALAGRFRGASVYHFTPLSPRSHPPVVAPHARSPHSLPVSVMQAVYWWAVFSFGYWLKIRPRVVRGELVLFDRYLVDAIVDPRRYRFGGPPWFMRVVWRACPKPDLVVLLDVAPDELQRRKQEVTPAESRQLAAAYRGVVEGLTNGRVIPTASPDSVQAAFCKLVRDLCPAPEAT